MIDTAFRKVFEGAKDWEATEAAEAWCREQGIAVGRMCAHSPRGLLFGDFDISKWYNMSAQEIAELAGTVTGDGRRGPIVVEITQATLEQFEQLHRSAAQPV